MCVWSKSRDSQPFSTCQFATGAPHPPKRRSRAPVVHLRHEVTHRCRTYTLATNRTNPRFCTDFLLAKSLLALRRTTRLSTDTNHVEIALDPRYIKNLLSTWCAHTLAPRINEIKILVDVCYVENLLSTWRRRCAPSRQARKNPCNSSMQGNSPARNVQ